MVVAIDGSEPSFKALSYASKLAGLTKSKVVVLHVILLPPGATSRTLEAVRKDLLSKGNELLAKATGIARSNGLDIETRMVETNHSVEMVHCRLRSPRAGRPARPRNKRNVGVWKANARKHRSRRSKLR